MKFDQAIRVPLLRLCILFLVVPGFSDLSASPYRTWRIGFEVNEDYYGFFRVSDVVIDGRGQPQLVYFAEQMKPDYRFTNFWCLSAGPEPFLAARESRCLVAVTVFFFLGVGLWLFYRKKRRSSD